MGEDAARRAGVPTVREVARHAHGPPTKSRSSRASAEVPAWVLPSRDSAVPVWARVAAPREGPVPGLTEPRVLVRRVRSAGTESDLNS